MAALFYKNVNAGHLYLSSGRIVYCTDSDSIEERTGTIASKRMFFSVSLLSPRLQSCRSAFLKSGIRRETRLGYAMVAEHGRMSVIVLGNVWYDKLQSLLP